MSCREEKKTAKAAQAKLEANRRKRAKDKAKAQQAKLAAATSDSDERGAAPFHGPGNASQTAAAGTGFHASNHTNSLSIQDVSQHISQQQHSENVQSHSKQPAPAGCNLQQNITAQTLDTETAAKQLLPTEGIGSTDSRHMQTASYGRDIPNSSQLALSLAQSDAFKAPQLEAGHGLCDPHDQQRTDHAAAGGSRPVTLSAVPHPGENAEGLLRGAEQTSQQLDINSVQHHLTATRKPKKQHRKKGKQTAADQTAPKPAADAYSLHVHPVQLTKTCTRVGGPMSSATGAPEAASGIAAASLYRPEQSLIISLPAAKTAAGSLLQGQLQKGLIGATAAACAVSAEAAAAAQDASTLIEAGTCPSILVDASSSHADQV